MVVLGTMIGGPQLGSVDAQRIKPPDIRHGEPLTARVRAIHGRDVASIEVLGRVIEIRTPVPLVPGTAIVVAFRNGADGPERLELHLASSDPTSRAARSMVLGEGRPGLPAGALLGITAATSAVRGRAVTASAGAMHGEGVESARTIGIDGGVADAERSEFPSWESGSLTTANLHNDSAGGLGTSRTEIKAAAMASPDAGHSDDDLQAGLPPAVHPYGLPDSIAAPLFLDDEEEDAQFSVDRERARSWTVRCTLESAANGSVDLVVNHAGGATAIRLLAEWAETSAFLQELQAELRVGLNQAGIQLEALEVSHVGPMPVQAAAQRAEET